VSSCHRGVRHIHVPVRECQKQLIVRWRESDLSSAIRAGIAAFAASYATGEPREGTTAFLEKRPARFTGE